MPKPFILGTVRKKCGSQAGRKKQAAFRTRYTMYPRLSSDAVVEDGGDELRQTDS